MNDTKLRLCCIGWPLVALFLSSCGGAQNETPTVMVAAASASPDPRSLESTTTAESIPAPERPNRCAADGPFPALPEAPKAVALLPCRPADAKSEKAVAEWIQKNFTTTRKGSNVAVKYDCNGLDGAITKIIYERGGGHGSMSIVRIERTDPAAPVYDVTGILLPRGMLRASPPVHYKIVKTQVSVDAVAVRMPLVRAALRAKVEEVGGSMNGGSAFGSTSNVHDLIRIEDASGRVLERRFDGYISSVEQEVWVPVEHAMGHLDAIVPALQWQPNAPVPDDVKQLFERQFVAAIPHFNDQWAWWVRENFVTLAAHAGTKALIPALLPLLGEPSTDTAKMSSEKRTREYAVDALITLTGWNPRAPTPGTGEKPHSTEEAAKEFREQCGKVGSVSPQR